MAGRSSGKGVDIPQDTALESWGIASIEGPMVISLPKMQDLLRPGRIQNKTMGPGPYS